MRRTAKVRWQILDASGKTVVTARAPAQQIAADGAASFEATADPADPALWSVDAPNLYSAIVTVETKGKPRDAERVSFGVRTVRFDADKGFLLNGKSLKIQGTCNHQDHAGVGAALPDRLQAFRIGVLKEMGCNAVRTSHNMPTPEWVEACDRMGMMMMCETRQMSSSPEGMAQLETMVKRYRNSPSIILWSIGNEEWHLQRTMAEQGAKIAATMVRRVPRTRPDAGGFGGGERDNYKGVSDAFDIIGFNYNLKLPGRISQGASDAADLWIGDVERHRHARRIPTDPLRNTVNAYDGVVPWGETAEDWWKFYGTREWLAGGFAWTGFDYRGEPTPYGWPSINSQFGIVDMCGFPEGQLLLLQGVVGQGAVAAPVSALELRGPGRRRDSGVGLHEPGRGGAVCERQEPGQPEGSASGPRGVEGEV